MSAMNPQQDGQQPGEGAVESVKIEKNTKGHNWSYRVVKKPGQEWRDVLAEIDELERELARRYGG